MNICEFDFVKLKEDIEMLLRSGCFELNDWDKKVIINIYKNDITYLGNLFYFFDKEINEEIYPLCRAIYYLTGFVVNFSFAYQVSLSKKLTNDEFDVLWKVKRNIYFGKDSSTNGVGYVV
jgi:hypothetical protein